MEVKEYDSVIFNCMNRPIKATVSAPYSSDNSDSEEWKIRQIILPKGFAAFGTPGNETFRLEVSWFKQDTRSWESTGAAYAWSSNSIALLVQETGFGVNISRREICDSWYASRNIVIDGIPEGFRPTDELVAEQEAHATMQNGD